MTLPYITTLPCDLCDDRRTVRAEPPYDICARSLYGSPLDEMTGEGCEKLAAVEAFSAHAVRTAEYMRVRWRHATPEVRDEQVRAQADVLFEDAREAGAEFDDEAWTRDCAPVRKARAA